MICPLSFYCSSHTRDLHSFPTRRSSDLLKRRLGSDGSDPAVRSLNGFGLGHAGQAGGELDEGVFELEQPESIDRKSTRLNSSHDQISYAVFCLKKKKYSRAAYPLLRRLT